ncbi:MAG: hypothetical protein ACOYVD_17100 [Bacillota bacterium]
MSDLEKSKKNIQKRNRPNFDVDSLYSFVRSINNIGQTLQKLTNVLGKSKNAAGIKKPVLKITRDNPPALVKMLYLHPRPIKASRSVRVSKNPMELPALRGNLPPILQLLYREPKPRNTSIKTIRPKLRFQPVKLDNFLKSIISGLKSLKIDSLLKPFNFLGKSPRPKKGMKPSNRIIVKRTFLSNQLIVIKPPNLQMENKDSQENIDIKENPPLGDSDIKDSSIKKKR